jgi:hypothetical protein
MVPEPLPSLRSGERAQMEGDFMRVASGDAGSQKGVIVTSYIAWVWEWVCAYIYIRTFLNTMHFKFMMAMNLSELRG